MVQAEIKTCYCLNCHTRMPETEVKEDKELGLLCPYCGAALIMFLKN